MNGYGKNGASVPAMGTATIGYAWRWSAQQAVRSRSATGVASLTALITATGGHYRDEASNVMRYLTIGVT